MRPFYTLWTTNRWLFVRVELLGTLLSLFISLLLVYKIDSIDAGIAGITLTFSSSLLEYVYWLMRQSTTVDKHFEAIEKVNEYMNMPQEPPGIVEGSRPPASWPTAGAVQIKDLMVSFSHIEIDAALKNVTITIHSGEKVALIGKNGAEKSALASSLFRFVEPMGGSIKIDGVNIAWIGVEDLRSRITYITKESWLLTGSVRSNLDPFGEYDDYALWQALCKVHLSKPLEREDPLDTERNSQLYICDLDYDIGKDGSRLSVCQRQLLSIARSLLQDCTRLVVFEEAGLATESQELILSVIEKEFQESTLLVIPYLLRRVVNFDKVIVFDQGSVAEIDTPSKLLNRQGSLLQLLCEKAGILAELTLDTI
ncbi:P-loop containing nucleoside triphosphate hydrolase protein [Sporodiniella umbellata]|nr:P-loop containing nucleoside triphosphate hydrolase protein [Sporodiniella umbellata]